MQIKELLKLRNKEFVIGSLAIILAAFLWSLDGTFIRPQFYDLPSILVVFLEHTLGFIILSPFIFIHWNKIKALKPKEWGAMLWVCVFGGLLGTWMITQAFFAAVSGETNFATVIILQKLQPIFALVMAAFILKEKPKKGFYGWAALAIIAGYFLAFGKTGLNFGEIDWFHNAAFFAVLAAFSFGSSTVFGKRFVNHLSFQATAALRFGITAILALIATLVTRNFLLQSVSSSQWGLLGVIVFTSGAVAIFLYYYGLKRVSASATTILELFWPLSAIILDYAINGNVLSPIQIIAVIVLLFSFYMVVRKGKTKYPSFKAKVISGKQRGRRLGFPTANLDRTDIDMPHGVYKAKVKAGRKKYQALLHFGYKKTFDEEASMELYIKDFKGKLYEKEVKVDINKKIRSIKKFDDKKELKKQINKDLQELKR